MHAWELWVFLYLLYHDEICWWRFVFHCLINWTHICAWFSTGFTCQWHLFLPIKFICSFKQGAVSHHVFPFVLAVSAIIRLDRFFSSDLLYSVSTRKIVYQLKDSLRPIHSCTWKETTNIHKSMIACLPWLLPQVVQRECACRIILQI